MFLLYHGNIFNENSQGTNELIKEGAIPVTSIDDFLNLWNNKYRGKEKTKEGEKHGRNSRKNSYNA